MPQFDLFTNLQGSNRGISILSINLVYAFDDLITTIVETFCPLFMQPSKSIKKFITRLQLG